jgi:hypothetical protein
MSSQTNKKSTPLMMILMLIAIAIPLSLKTIGVSVNFSCMASATFRVWAKTMRTMGSMYHPSIAADFATFGNSLTDEQMNDPCTNDQVCSLTSPAVIEQEPELTLPVIIEEETAKPKCLKSVMRVVTPKQQQFQIVVNAEPVAVQITPEPVQLRLTPVAFHNVVRVKELRKAANLTQAFAQAEVWKNYTVREDEVKRRVEQLARSCNFAGLQALQEKEKLLKVVVRMNPRARDKDEFPLTVETETSEF